MSVPAVDWEQTRATLESIARRVCELVGRVPDPSAPGTGEWTAAETAAHLTHSYGVNLGIARATREAPEELSAPGMLVQSVSVFNAVNLEADPERDLHVLGPRIDQRAREFLEETAGAAGDEPVQWLGGAKLPISSVACHMIGEALLHGADIGRGSGLPWAIPGPAAALASQGFTLALLDAVDPRAFVDQRRGAGLTARVDMRIRRGASVVFILEDGALRLEHPPERGADCHVSVDPVANYLMGWGRLSPVRAMVGGKLVVWGRKPWMAARLLGALRTP